MLRVKIYGAGSIGNHLAHASRQLGWQVVVCDPSEEALKRMRGEIYPSRYGSWDQGIRQYTNAESPKGGFDLILVGTPPEHHLPVALEAVREAPRGIMVEKPVCTPSLELAQTLFEQSEQLKVFVGYDHVVSLAVSKGGDILRSGCLGDIRWIDVEFREHWEGIFAAHPWLNGPGDSYLGYWRQGGGASGEHSHALNLWQHLAIESGNGRVNQVNACMSYQDHQHGQYDTQCMMNLRTERGLMGRVVQDVVTSPASKQAKIHGENGTLQIVIGYRPGCDAVIVQVGDEPQQVHEFPKSRPDDFIQELQHIAAELNSSSAESPISLARGLDTMLVIAAAHESESTGCRMQLNYDHGYSASSYSRCVGNAASTDDRRRQFA